MCAWREGMKALDRFSACTFAVVIVVFAIFISMMTPFFFLSLSLALSSLFSGSSTYILSISDERRWASNVRNNSFLSPLWRNVYAHALVAEPSFSATLFDFRQQPSSPHPLFWDTLIRFPETSKQPTFSRHIMRVLFRISTNGRRLQNITFHWNELNRSFVCHFLLHLPLLLQFFYLFFFVSSCPVYFIRVWISIIRRNMMWYNVTMMEDSHDKNRQALNRFNKMSNHWLSSITAQAISVMYVCTRIAVINLCGVCVCYSIMLCLVCP